MVDFTNSPINPFKGYGGANGNKINIIFEGKSYMLKFPPVPTKNTSMSYSNSCVSEYLACNIFKMLGMDAQETILGFYTDKRGKQKVVVACADFTAGGNTLMEFAHLKNTCVDSEQNGYGTDLNSIMATIEEQILIDPIILKEFFWDMFIVDALLGNFDRHNGNWGLLVDAQQQKVKIAPIYDCGSCLYPQLDAEQFEVVLNDQTEIDKRIYKFPTSAIFNNESKISYFEYISSLENEDCNEALKRICDRLNIEKIYELIENTEILTVSEKRFYKVMIAQRKAKILDFSYKKLLSTAP